jgi:hypothetical protein
VTEKLRPIITGSRIQFHLRVVVWALLRIKAFGCSGFNYYSRGFLGYHVNFGTATLPDIISFAYIFFPNTLGGDWGIHITYFFLSDKVFIDVKGGR